MQLISEKPKRRTQAAHVIAVLSLRYTTDQSPLRHTSSCPCTGVYAICQALENFSYQDNRESLLLEPRSKKVYGTVDPYSSAGYPTSDITQTSKGIYVLSRM